jgi:transposase-like protein
VKAALHTIMNAENKEAADLAIDQFEATYATKYPKTVDKMLEDHRALLAHFDFPAAHWVHLRTTNAIEPTFATVRLRTRKTKGAGIRTAGLGTSPSRYNQTESSWPRPVDYRTIVYSNLRNITMDGLGKQTYMTVC